MFGLQGLLLVFHAVGILGATNIFEAKITLDNGTFTGVSGGVVHNFFGIPFAKPPVGSLRYNLPQSIPPYSGNYDASKYGPSCPQQAFTVPAVPAFASETVDFLVNSIYGQVFPDSEDCLTLNVVKPASAGPESRLPVVVWIFGGGFEFGGTTIYNGDLIVSRSIALGEPVIFVSMNYRVSGFGFLASKEVEQAKVGNLGLHDQREALRWVQRYITQFGGDPSKVTIFGESAGAISVSLHMIASGGQTDGLFRAGFMMSGAPIPLGDIKNGQGYYDALVKDTGCTGAKDTLECLRNVPYDELKAAINKTPGVFSYQSIKLAWAPRRDGVFLTDSPQKLVEGKKVANIPYVTGNCDDEGTLFSLSTLNVTTEEGVKAYIKTYLLPKVSDSEIDKLLTLYPSNALEGSPFNTGIANALTPQFKRIAALQGDGVFQAPRKLMLENTIPENPNVWVYLSKRLKVLPILGALHSSDILNMFGGGELADYLIHFANHLDPNSNAGLLHWPKYDFQSQKVMTFLDGLPTQAITQDTYRKDGIETLKKLFLANPL